MTLGIAATPTAAGERVRMIDFNCPQCASSFSVPVNLAGRRARCKKCGTPITIPTPDEQKQVVLADVPPGPKLRPRERRLKADADQMKAAFEKFPLIKVRSMLGDPP